jgi:hypothetical protein
LTCKTAAWSLAALAPGRRSFQNIRTGGVKALITPPPRSGRWHRILPRSTIRSRALSDAHRHAPRRSARASRPRQTAYKDPVPIQRMTPLGRSRWFRSPGVLQIHHPQASKMAKTDHRPQNPCRRLASSWASVCGVNTACPRAGLRRAARGLAGLIGNIFFRLRSHAKLNLNGTSALGGGLPGR